MKNIGAHRVKVVPDPISGIVDIEPVLAMVETPAFQTLADKRQLGMSYLVFRAALHTRLSHCLGAYQATATLADRWLRQGFIETREERDALAAYALYHDIGHPAFSHVTEDFCPLDDDEKTLDLIRGPLKDAIAACGVDQGLMESLASHQNPLYRAVHDKNLGMEKLDYLERDGFYTSQGKPAGLEYLRKYIYFIDGQVVIDEKVVDHAADSQVFYMKMYKNVYLRKPLAIAQRMFHKAVYHLILCGELDPDRLYQMTDSELLGMLFLSANETVRNLYRQLRERTLFREAVVVRPEAFLLETRVADKPIAVFGLAPTDMDRLVHAPALQKKNHLQLDQLEERIEDAVGLPRWSVLVVPVFNPERFQAKDVTILGSDDKLHSLRERRPAHFVGMEETARSYTALRVCTNAQHRAQLSEPATAAKVMDLLMSAGS